MLSRYQIPVCVCMCVCFCEIADAVSVRYCNKNLLMKLKSQDLNCTDASSWR